MFSRTLRLGRIRGIDVRVSPSLPLFALVVLWAFATRFAPGHGYAVALAMGGAGMLLFFASILVHELGHALEASHRHLEVVGITLSMFGGVTEMHAEQQTARDELAVAAIGPYLSLLCAAVFGLVATFASDVLPVPAATTVAEVAGLLGWINVALAAFNLIPGSPLDGGRVLRAALWAVLRDRQRAVVAAARFGQALWLALIVVSVWGYVQRDDLRLTAALGAIVGLFLFDAARREVANARLDALYTEWTVDQLLISLPAPVDADDRVTTLAPGEPGAGPGSQLAIVIDGGEPAGLLDLAQLADVTGDSPATSAGSAAGPPAGTTTRPGGLTVRDLARPFDGLPRVAFDDDLHVLVDRFQGDAGVVIVERDGTPIAAVTEREAALAIGLLREGRAARNDRDARRDTQRTGAGS